MEVDKRNNTLMSRIIKYFLIVIFSMALLNTYSTIKFKSFYGNFYTMLTRLVDIYSISFKIDTMCEDINNYAHSGDTNYLTDYKIQFDAILVLCSNLKNETSEQEYYKFLDIYNMILSFDEKSKIIISESDKHVQLIYINDSVSDLTRLKGYIEDEVKNVLLGQIGAIMTYYRKFINDIGSQQYLIYLLTALITAICIIIAIRFSREISRPIHQLVLNLAKVAKGEFEVEKINIKTDDEIDVLIESFTLMTAKIKELIEEIKAKADIEKELSKEQIKNLEISNLLNQSELKFLQSQINPHFLYNTLNSISALALLEGAEQTMKMIGCISEIMKYYLKKIDENVTLKEEFKIIENYVYLQKVRFGDRIKFELNYDEGAMGHCVPSMILQPFVENAIIHGLEPLEEKGKLNVRIMDMGSDILLKVEDNGVGINEEILSRFFEKEESIPSSANRGIGVANVIRRLELKYGRNVVEIKSSKDKGTEVNILLPKDNLEVKHQ